MQTKGCEKGYLYVALIVIVLMGAIIVVQHDEISQPVPQDLPACEFSVVLNWHGGGAHPGYWVEMDDSLKSKECIIRFDEGRVPIPAPE